MTIPQAVQAAEPTSEPLSLIDVRKHLELGDNTHHDTHLGQLIEAARNTFEDDTGLVTITRSFVECLDSWPDGDGIPLKRRPVSAITSIVYVDADGANQTWSATKYTLDVRRTTPVIWLNYLESWPTIRAQANAVTITYAAGYATAAAIPESHKLAMLTWIAARFYARDGGEPFGVAGADRYSAGYNSLIRLLQRSTYP